jgi:hypothetical protein
MLKFKQFVEEVESYELTEEDLLTLSEEDKKQYEAIKHISFRARQAKSRLMKKLGKTKLKVGRKMWKRKLAPVKRLAKRARRVVRRAFMKKVGGGKAPSSVGAKNVAMKRLATKGLVKRATTQAKLGIKVARKRDMTRKSGGAGKRRTG